MLLQRLKDPLKTWPTIYPVIIDVVANQLTSKHYSRGRTITLYNHLDSFGQDHKAKLVFYKFEEFAYKPKTAVLFSDKVLAHLIL